MTIDAEYLGSIGAHDFHQDIYTKVPSKKTINYHKPLEKGWRTKKRELWPDLGTYKQAEENFKKIIKGSPRWNIAASERKLFTY